MKRFLAAWALPAVFCLALLGGCAQKEPAGETVSSPSPPVSAEAGEALFRFDPEEVGAVEIHAHGRGAPWRADEETKREIVERLLKFRFQTAEYLGDTDWALAELTLWREGEDEPVFTVENLGDDWLKADGILYYPTEGCGGLAEWGGSLAQRALEAREEAEP